MHVGALTVEIHIADSRSLKAKRSVVRHLLDTSRRRYGVAASEVEFQDLWQRAGLCFAAVANEASQVERRARQRRALRLVPSRDRGLRHGQALARHRPVKDGGSSVRHSYSVTLWKARMAVGGREGERAENLPRTCLGRNCLD